MSRVMFLVYCAIAIGMGCFLALQAGVNGQLRLRTGDPVRAALLSSAIAATSLLVYSLVAVREPWPSADRLIGGPWWLWIGGVLGAVYVATSLVLVTRLGSTLMFALIVVGQMVAARFLDHYGLLGIPRHEVSPLRILGVGLLVVGVVLIRRF